MWELDYKESWVPKNWCFWTVGLEKTLVTGWQYTALTYSISYLEPVCCSMSSSNCCFLTCIQVSQETGQSVWYSRLFKNFPQFIVIHTVKGFGVVNKSEIVLLHILTYLLNQPSFPEHWLLYLDTSHSKVSYLFVEGGFYIMDSRF